MSHMIFAKMIDNGNEGGSSITLNCSDVSGARLLLEPRFCGCSEKVKHLSEDLSGCNARVSDLLRTIEDLNEQVAVEKYAAYRWWLAHDELRAQLDSVGRDRIWKSVRPLHAARRLFGKALKLTKHILRPMILGVVKKILANPRLYRIIKPISRKFPLVHERLRRLIMSEQMIGTQEAFFGEDIQEHTTVYLDKRAVRVLADLKQAKGGK